MNDATTAAMQALQLPDEVFHSSSNEAFDRLAKTLAPRLEYPQPGKAPSAEPTAPVFALGLPRVVDTDRGPTVPGALLLRYRGQRQWEVDFKQNLMLIVVDLHSGLVSAVNPFQVSKLTQKPRPSRTEPRPSTVNLNAINYMAKRFLLPGVFGDNWPSPAFAVTAIDYDWVTNTAVIERRPPLVVEESPPRAPSAFIHSAAADAAGTAGATLTVEASGRSVMATSVRLALPRSAVTLARSTAAPTGFVMVGQLLLMRLDEPQPVIIELIAPVMVGDDTVSAKFSFDLAQRPEVAALAGAYQIYLVCGRTVVGPSALTIAGR